MITSLREGISYLSLKSEINLKKLQITKTEAALVRNTVCGFYRTGRGTGRVARNL